MCILIFSLKILRYTMTDDKDDKANSTNAEKPATAKQVEELSNNLAAMKTYIPTFWPDNAEAWFIGADTQFDLAGITREKTKFQKIVSVLPEDVAVQVQIGRASCRERV